MRRLIYVLYGLAAYTLGMATLAYLVGFTGNLLVPTSVDKGASEPVAHAVGVNLLLLALFGVQHSVMARRGFKRWWCGVMPPAIERSTYLVATCLVLALLFAFWVPIPTPLVWQVHSPAGTTLLWSLFALGWVIVVISSYLIDHFELFGLRQAFAPLAHRSPREIEFRTPLLYRHVRHPLYVGFLVSLWAAPVMSMGHLLFAAGLSLYILIGIVFEERDLIHRFGERYRRYREEVAMLVPFARTRARGAAQSSAAEEAGVHGQEVR